MAPDKLQDKCGLFAVHGDPDAVSLVLRGMSALQHRGQESAGIAYVGQERIECVKVLGDVRELVAWTGALMSFAAVGHVRYATCGERSLEMAQPFVSCGPGGQLALGHNGHIVGIDHLRALSGPSDESSADSDTELLARRVAAHFTTDIGSAVEAGFAGVTPAYSVAVLTRQHLCAVRDSFGIRPLSIGRKGRATVVSSETCAFDAIGATYVRDVDPGEIVVVAGDELRSQSLASRGELAAHCIFELIYFARPDSVMFGQSVAEFRTRLGKRLAVEAPAYADIVVPVPDSAVHSAVGYAHTSGIQLAMALFRSNVVGRTFIEPTPATRTAAVLAKLNPIASLVNDRRVVLVDDSVVRGTTCLHLVRRLRAAGAREVHVRVSSPPTIASCHFGIDTPNISELFASGRDLSAMQHALGADSLEFLSLEGLYEVAKGSRDFCAGCFSGTYPVEVPGLPAFPLRAEVRRQY